MTRNLCCKLLLITVFGSIVVSNFIFCDVLIPEENELKEVLHIHENSRDYFLVYNKPLHYTVEGPVRLEIISRRAIPKTSRRRYDFGYQLQMESQSVLIHHSKRKFEAISSDNHPGHGYTYSGSCIVTIPAGTHTLTISPEKKGKPVLVRVIEKFYPRVTGKSEYVTPIGSSETKDLLIGNKTRKYTVLTQKNPLGAELNRPGKLSVYGRFGFDANSGDLGSYQIQVWKNGKPSIIIVEFADNTNYSRRKNRIGQFNITEADQNISFQLVESTGSVYLRLLKYGNYE